MATKRRGSIYDATMAGLYDLEETIGRGHFAVVKLARHVFTGEKVAVKVIDKIKLDPVSREHLFQEVRCMKLVQHPNIVRLYEVIDTHSKLFLILELGDYDMYEYIIKYERGVAEPEAQLYFCQIVQAISFCHKLHVVHRDLKPENVVFFEKLGMVKLTDFGFSNLFSPGQKLETSCGSLAYSAPEILLGDSYDAPAVDLWSLGVILYMLVCGRLPFQEANDSETLTKILDCSFTVPTHLSTECKQLISRMLVREPSCRASLDEIENNPWVCAGELGHAQSLPLVSRTHLTEENHQQILEQMLTGGIAAPDEVVGALERDEYNYVTATYYLLAERLLRRERLEQAQKLASQNNTAANGTENNLQLESLALSPRVQNKQRMEPANQKSATEAGQVPSRLQERICSVLQEEDEVFHRSRSRGSSPLISPSHSCSSLQQHAKVGRQSGCSSTNNSPTPQELQDELKDLSHRVSYPSWPGAATCDRSGSRSPSPLDVSGRISPVVAKYKGPVPIAGSRKLPTVSSSPHLLEICEEVEEDGEAFGGSGTLTQRSSNSSLPRSSEQTYSAVRMIRPRQAVVSPDVIRRYDRVAVICKSRRSTSCSSSEASDDDSEKKRFGLFTSRCRRDSDPDDDRNEPPSNGPGPGLNGSNGATGTNKSSHGSSTSSNQKSSSRQKHTKGSTKANSGQQMSMVSKETEKHRHLLDPRKLAYRLKKLALAPINEVPHLAPTLWIWAQSARWSSRRRMLTRSNCSMPAVEDLSITVLEKPKSCENLTGSRLLLRERAKPLANSWHVLQNSALDTSLHVFSACSCIDGLQAGCTNSAICGASTLENRTNVPKCNVTSRKYNCSDKLVNQTQSLSATCEVEQGGSFKELFRSNEKQLDGGFQCMLKHACKRKKRRKAHGIPRRCGFTDSPLNNSWISPEFNDCSGASSVSECMSCCDMLGVSLRLR